MLKRWKKKNKGAGDTAPQRVLVVDDDADAARLVAQILRKDGFEVGDLSDMGVAQTAIAAEPEALGAVVISFTDSGTTACLEMLDAIRTHPDPRVNQQRVVVVLDSPRQQIFTWQAGADEVLSRPYHANHLVERITKVLSRPDSERTNYRRDMIHAIERGDAAEPVTADSDES